MAGWVTSSLAKPPGVRRSLTSTWPGPCQRRPPALPAATAQRAPATGRPRLHSPGQQGGLRRAVGRVAPAEQWYLGSSHGGRTRPPPLAV